jgi:sugar phosphate isomerase/epimerase
MENIGGVVTMKLGCSSVIFNQLDLYGALQHIAWAGYEGAELACLANLARHINLDTKQSYLQEVKATADKFGLGLFAIHSDVGSQPGEDKITSMITLFDIACKLGIPIVTMGAGGNSKYFESMREELKYLRKMSAEAANRGVTLAIKTHIGTPIYNTATLLQMLDEIDSPGLGVTLDTLNLYKVGDDPAETVRKIGKKIVHVHLREYPDVPDRQHYSASIEEKIPGRGALDFPKILKSLKVIDYQGALDFDIIGAFTLPLSRQMGIAAETRGYFNRCLQELG